MFFLGFLVGAVLMVVAANLSKRFDELKKWNDNKE